MKNISNNNSYKKLNNIIEVTYDIISLYRDIICIESTENIDNEEYKYLYNRLLYKVNEENKLYKTLYNNPYEARKLCEYISINFSFDDEESDTFVDRDLVFLRIFKTLCDCFILVKDYIDDSLEMFFKNEGMECDLRNLDIRSKQGLMYYLKCFKEDLEFSYLHFIDDFIFYNRKVPSINNILINEKYQKIIIDKSLERRVIFNKGENLDISSKFIYDMNICNKDVCDSLTYVYCNFHTINCISNLLDIQNNDYKDVDSVADSIINQSMMRACLLFMDDDNIMGANDSYHEHIDNNKDINKDNPNSQKLIVNGFKKVKFDKLKQRMIRFKYK